MTGYSDEMSPKAAILLPCTGEGTRYRSQTPKLHGHNVMHHCLKVYPTMLNRSFFAKPLLLSAVAVSALLVSGCSTSGEGDKARKVDLAASKVTTIGVNSYLWRASLDALSFMPLLQADANSGVIITDWYTNPSNPGERMKVSVSILDQDLRADAVRVAASRQVAQGGGWVDAPVQAATVQKLEEIILTKARDLRASAING